MKKLYIILFSLFILGGSAFASTPFAVTTASFTQNGFTVAWYSETAEIGYIKFGTSVGNVVNITADARGALLSDKIHYVRVRGLNPDTQYYFSIHSGTTTDNNNGNFYPVRTALANFSSQKGIISVQNILRFNSLVAVTKDAVVFAKAINGSNEESFLSAVLYNESITTDPYYQYFVFSNFKKKDGDVFGSLSVTDKIYLYAWSGSDGFGGYVTVNAIPYSSVVISLNQLSITGSIVIDTTTPSAVTSATANSGINSIDLSWTASISTNNAGTRIVKNTGAYPVSVTDGVVIDIAGNSGYYSDTSVTLGITYYYALFAYTASSKYSTAVHVSAIPTASVVYPGIMFDNYETGAILSGPSYQNLFAWYDAPFNDSGNGGNSSYAFSLDNTSAALGTTQSAKINYTLGNNSYVDRFIGFSLNITKDTAIMNMSTYKAIEFWAKGSGNKLSFKLNATPTNVSYNSYFIEFNTTTNWKRYVVAFSDLVQPSYGPTASITTVLQNMIGIQFMPSSKVASEPGWFNLDEIKFITLNVASNISPSVIPTPNPTPPTISVVFGMLDDFETGTDITNWNSYAYAYNDSASPNFGNSTGGISINNIDAANGTTYSAVITYNLRGAYCWPFFSMGINLTPNNGVTPTFNGVTFWAKGDGHKVDLELACPVDVSGSLYTTYNYYYYPLTTSTNWVKYTVPFIQFKQPMWGDQIKLSDVLINLEALHFKASSQVIGETGTFRIDEVRFITSSYALPIITDVTINRVTTTSISFDWTNDSNVSWILIRNTSDFAVDRNGGQVLFNGVGQYLLDTSLVLNQPYYYTLFAKSTNDVYSNPRKLRVELTTDDIQLGYIYVSNNIYIDWNSVSSGNYIGNDVIMSIFCNLVTKNGGAATLNIGGPLPQSLTIDTYVEVNTKNIHVNLWSGNFVFTFNALDWNGQKAKEKSILLKRDPLMFVDFENKGLKNYWAGYGYGYDDTLTPNNGNSIVTVNVNNQDGANGSFYSVSVSYTLVSGSTYPFAGFGTDVTANQGELDLSAYNGFEFWVKGDGHRLALELGSNAYSSPNYYFYEFNSGPFNASPTWSKVVLPFVQFTQPAWGAAVSLDTVLKRMKIIQFKASSRTPAETGWFRLDEFKFISMNIPIPHVISVTYNRISTNSIGLNVSFDANSTGISVIRSTSNFPDNRFGSEVIYSGSLGNFVDSGLSLNVPYYYNVYSYSALGVYSSPRYFPLTLRPSGEQTGQVMISNNILVDGYSFTSGNYIPMKTNLSLLINLLSTSNSTFTLNITGAINQTRVISASSYFVSLDIYAELPENATSINFNAIDWDGQSSVTTSLVFKRNNKAIADFENRHLKDLWGAYGYVYADNSAPNNGNSTASVVVVSTDGALSTSYSVLVSYNLGAIFADRFAGFGMDLSPNAGVSDVSMYDGIEFWIKGDAHKVSVELNSTKYVSPNFYNYSLTTTASWTKVVIPFIYFTQPNWGGVLSINQVLQYFSALQLKASSKISGESGWFMLDQVKFVTFNTALPLVISVNNTRLATPNIALSWTTNTSCVGVIVVKSATGIPIDRNDGVQIYNGLPSGTATENGLIMGQTYYYGIIGYDANGIYSPLKPYIITLVTNDFRLGMISISTNMFIDNYLTASGNYIGKQVTFSVLIEPIITGNYLVTVNFSGAISKVVTLGVYNAVNTIDISLTLPNGSNQINIDAIDWNGQETTRRSLTLKRDPALITDFENRQLKNYWMGYGYVYADNTSPNFGNSTVNGAVDALDGANGTPYSVSVTYSLGAIYPNRFAGFGFDVSANQNTSDVTAYKGVEFWLKGDGHDLSLELASPLYASPNYFTYYVGKTSVVWKKYTIPFSFFAQPSWGPTRNRINVLTQLSSLQFKASSQLIETGWFRLDEVKFITNDVVTPAPVTNLSANIANDTPLTFRVSWLNPTNNFSYVTVLKKSTGYSTAPNDGSLIYTGTGVLVTDNLVTEDKTFFYTVYAYDTNGNYSVPTKIAYLWSSGGGSQTGWLDVSANFYTTVNNKENRLLDSDYTNNTLTINVYIYAHPVSASAVASLNVTGAYNRVITFNPSSTWNMIPVAVVLTNNTNVIYFQAIDWDGNLSQPKTLLLRVADSGELQGLKAGSKILTLPMPFNPDLGNNMTIAYELNKAGDTELLIYNINGRLVYRDRFYSYFEGAKAGYNEITVSSKDSFGNVWSNGLYIIRIVSGKRVFGTGKFLVIR